MDLLTTLVTALVAQIPLAMKLFGDSLKARRAAADRNQSADHSIIREFIDTLKGQADIGQQVSKELAEIKKTQDEILRELRTPSARRARPA